MEPVEINAGNCYLRAFRADDRLDDRPALVEAFADDAMRTYVRQFQVDDLDQAGQYVETRLRGWETEDRASWAIAEPTTGKLVGEVGLKNLTSAAVDGVGEAAIWVAPSVRGTGIADAALSAAVRFGMGALDLRQVAYVCDEDNKASAALAERCGFSYAGLTSSLDGVPSQLWTLTAD